MHSPGSVNARVFYLFLVLGGFAEKLSRFGGGALAKQAARAKGRGGGTNGVLLWGEGRGWSFRFDSRLPVKQPLALPGLIF